MVVVAIALAAVVYYGDGNGGDDDEGDDDGDADGDDDDHDDEYGDAFDDGDDGGGDDDGDDDGDYDCDENDVVDDGSCSSVPAFFTTFVGVSTSFEHARNKCRLHTAFEVAKRKSEYTEIT